MARRKETIPQTDFSFGQVRQEAIERVDTEIVQRSLSRARNTISLTSGQIEIRPATIHLGEGEAKEGIECDIGSGRVYDLHITPSGVVLYDSNGSIEFTGAVDWVSVPGVYGSPDFEDMDFWVIPDPNTASILIGCKYIPIYAVVLDGDAWSIGEAEFSKRLNDGINQPYWRYHRGVTIRPSGISGLINIQASEPIWEDAHAGTVIRYVDREIILGSKISDTVIYGYVLEELPQTHVIVVEDSSSFEVGEAVEEDTLGGQGIITDIVGNQITVLPTSNFNEFENNELIGPNARVNITSVTDAADAAQTFLWDMQMLSPVYGYAGFGARHQGRVFLCGFPEAPQAFAVSVAGEAMNFFMGDEDDEGFVETLGSDRGGDLRYIISAEDLIFMTSRGLYYQQTRDGSPITPRSIYPVAFSNIGVANIRPVEVDDGAVFIDAVGKQIHAAILAGDVYRSWKPIPMTRYHGDVVKDPVYIGATSTGSERPEDFIYVVGADGEAAVCQWDRSGNVISWRPWDTQGEFKSIYHCFGKTYCIADRLVGGETVRFRERFETGVYLDCSSDVATHLEGEVAATYFEGWDLGDNEINASGLPIDGNGNLIEFPAYEGDAQTGFLVDMKIVPWARRSVDTYRGTRDVKRLIDLYVTVQDTLEFEINGFSFGGYAGNDDFTLPPPARSEEYRFEYFGDGPFEEISITKRRPGPFRMTKLKHRVTV